MLSQLYAVVSFPHLLRFCARTVFPFNVVIIVIAFPPVALPTFIGTIRSSDFQSGICLSCFIIAWPTYSLPWKTRRDLPGCRLFYFGQHAMLLDPGVQKITCIVPFPVLISVKSTTSSSPTLSFRGSITSSYCLRPVALLSPCLTFGFTPASPMFTCRWLACLTDTGYTPA